MVPHPPLLVPDLVPGRVDSTEPVRAACVEAARRLAETSRSWLAVAAGPGRATIGPHVRGSFRGYGVDLPVALSARAAGEERAELSLPGLIAGWLRERAGADSVVLEQVPGDASVADCVATGAALAGRDEKALLVLGDGSYRHGQAAPGYADERAGDFDDEIATALAEADPETLLATDVELAAELGAVGRAPWQVLAGLARQGPGWCGDLLYSAAPFGVGYHVAVWDRS